jgi:hypothetical protein
LRLIVQIRQRRCEVVPLVHGFLTRPASQPWSSNQASAFPPRLGQSAHTSGWDSRRAAAMG